MAIGEKIGGGASASAVKAGEAFFEVSVDDKGVLPQLKRVANRFAYLGGALQSIGLTAAKAGTLALAPMLALFGAAVERGDRLQDLSERFGETAETMSALGFAAERAGIKFEELQDGVKKLDELTKRGLDGDGKALLALAQMGEDARSFSEMGLADKLIGIADTFEEMTDPLARSQFLFNVFGENARKFLPLIEQGSEGIQESFKRAAATGEIVTTEQAAQAAKLKDTFDDMYKSVKNTLLSVGFAMFGFGDSITETGDKVTGFLGRVREWATENAGLIRSIAQISAGVIAAGLAVAGLGKAITLVGPAVGLVKSVVVTAFTVMTTLIGGLLSPIGLVVAGIGGIVAALLAWTDTGKAMRGELVSTFQSIGETLSETWGGIVDAVKGGDLELAFEILGRGVKSIWAQLMLGLTKAFQQFGKDLIDSPLGRFNDYMTKKTGIGVMTTDILGAMDATVAKRQKEVDAALAGLKTSTAKAKELRNAAGPEAAPMPREADREKERRKQKEMYTLGDSVRGTFGSANYRGALGAGKANEYAKKANEELKKIKEELMKLNKKPGPMFL